MNTDHLFAGVEAIKDAVNSATPDSDLLTCLALRDALVACATELTLARDRLDQHIAPMLDADSVTLPGYGVVHRKKNLGKHQLERGKEMLIADVLDSRIFDDKTGELIEETPVQKLLACWDHSVHGIRTSAMKTRGLKWGDYAETIDKGWKIDVRREGK